MTTMKRRAMWALATAVSLACVLWPLGASAQTYVRPSKGAAFEPFGVVQPVIGSTVARTSSVYDWTAFSGVRVDILSRDTTARNNGDPGGTLCSEVTPLTRVFPLVSNYIKLSLSASAAAPGGEFTHMASLGLYVSGSGVKEGPFATEEDGYLYRNGTVGDSGLVTDFGVCPLTVVVTPFPFTQFSTIKIAGTEAHPVTSTGSNSCAYKYGPGTSWTVNPAVWTNVGAQGNDLLSGLGSVSTLVCVDRLNFFGPVSCSQSPLVGTNFNANDSRAETVLYPGDCATFFNWYSNVPGTEDRPVYCTASQPMNVSAKSCWPEPARAN